MARENNAANLSKSVELERRLGRLEVCCNEFADTLKLLRKELIALQAQIDHVDARVNRT